MRPDGNPDFKPPAPTAKRRSGRANKSMTEAYGASRVIMAQDLIPRGLCLHLNCKTCALAHTNEPLQYEINTQLLKGLSPNLVSAYTAQQGYKISAPALTKHRDNHLMKNVGEGVVRHAEITALASSLGDTQDSNIAVVLSRLVCVLLLPAVASLHDDQLKKLAPEKLLDMALLAANAAGRVQSGDATTRLRELELQLKALRLDGAQRAQITAGVDAIRGRLQRNPEIWAQIAPLLQQVSDAAGEKPPPDPP
jgi:hypothetical protein